MVQSPCLHGVTTNTCYSSRKSHYTDCCNVSDYLWKCSKKFKKEKKIVCGFNIWGFFKNKTKVKHSMACGDVGHCNYGVNAEAKYFQTTVYPVFLRLFQGLIWKQSNQASHSHFCGLTGNFNIWESCWLCPLLTCPQTAAPAPPASC